MAIAMVVVHSSALAQRPVERPGLRVIDYRIELTLPDSGAAIAARATLTVARSARADTIPLDLVGLAVDSVLVNDRPVAFTRDSTELRVPLPAGQRDSLRVTVRYGGAPDDGLIIREHDGRWTAFGDDWPRRARYWIPSTDQPDDKATVTWVVTAPADRTVVANGEMQERVTLVGARGEPLARTTWREHRPIPTYTMVIAVATMVRWDLGDTACGLAERARCVHQEVYVAPESKSFLPGPFARAGEMVEYFARLVAPFPYERLAHLESSTRFGGMENATAIFYSEESIRAHTLGEATVAHETAHQWFGDAVTESRFADLWLSEGFATYWSALWTRHAEGDSAFREVMRRARDEITASRASAERPVVDSAEQRYLALLNTNSYQKGGWVLHMLRASLGDSVFFRGVRAYYLEHRDGNARTEDLERSLESTAGRSLRWFFDQWLRRPGWPELRTRWRYDASRHRVTLEVEQGPRFAPYRFPLTVELRDADGRPRRATVDVAAARSQRVVLPIALDAPPRSLAFDPDVELLATFDDAR